MKVKKKNENILMIVLAFTVFGAGIWSNYRGLWLQDVGYTISGISKILSVALICSSVTAFIISVFSTKIKVKSIIILSYIFKIISFAVLLITRSNYLIKSCILMCIMCDVIFSISFYPLLSFESRSNNAYKRKMLIEYVFKDIGIVLCGLLIGRHIGKLLFDYNSCIILSMASSIISCLFLLSYKSSEENIKKRISLSESMKSIMSSKVNRVFLINQIVCYISYGIVFDLMMLILTNFVGFEVSYAGLFIIGANMFGTFFSFLFSKISKDYSVGLSAFIKYGTRAIVYLIAFKINNAIVYIFAIIYAYVMSRVLEDKVTGTFLEQINEKNQFLFGNIRYLALCVGEGIGAYLAGVLLEISFSHLFLGAGIVTIVQTLIFIYLGKLNSAKKY